MIICEVLQDGRRYTFTAKCKLGKGVNVMCNTRYGKAPGTVAECFEVHDTGSVLFRRYLELMGAKEPLKEVVGVYVPLEWVEARMKEKEIIG